MENSLCDTIPIIISNIIKEGTLPCPSYISITGQRNEKIEYILFQNYYVSSINIQQINREGRWVTILSDFRLTNYPHFENDAENWYIIPSNFFNENFIPTYFKELRIYLNQPSPNWRDFTLRNIQCFTVREKPVIKKNEPTSAFCKLKEKLQEKIETLTNASGSDLVSYEETMNGIVEVTRLEVSQLQ
ncbi:hypothetical protein SteCoe_19040 [Stentor coeruleus]|uniref:Uncharacterized protein n=1 Tax=Stentor coeruleus TaxID=5963 RepID=A0A1R2BVE1_9CILI|nr:hypothetical protein SteCoe_19040 [Stentor coeruleus]